MSSGSQITYQVTRVTPETRYPPGEQPVAGKSVAFTTSAGYTGTVFAPDSVFSDAAAVRRLVEDQVQLVAAEMQITGEIRMS